MSFAIQWIAQSQTQREATQRIEQYYRIETNERRTKYYKEEPPWGRLALQRWNHIILKREKHKERKTIRQRRSRSKSIPMLRIHQRSTILPMMMMMIVCEKYATRIQNLFFIYNITLSHINWILKHLQPREYSAWAMTMTMMMGQSTMMVNRQNGDLLMSELAVLVVIRFICYDYFYTKMSIPIFFIIRRINISFVLSQTVPSLFFISQTCELDSIRISHAHKEPRMKRMKWMNK